jgi:hypothetical protein
MATLWVPSHQGLVAVCQHRQTADTGRRVGSNPCAMRRDGIELVISNAAR